MHLRRILLVTTLLLGVAQAEPLPEGLHQSGGVIMMEPIPDSDQPTHPSVPPEHRVSSSHILSPADHDTYTAAFQAADRGDWPVALAVAARGHDPMARRLVQWRYLKDKNSKASFAEIDAFVRSNPDWPQRATLNVRGEEAMDPATSPAGVVAWFAGRDPNSSAGAIRLGDALIATGKVADGSRLVRDGWISGIFDPGQELAIVRRDGAYLTPDVDRRRLDNLLWHDEITAARREMARVDDTTQRLASARMAIKNNPQAAQSVIAALPANIASDPFLLFDRARAARRSGDYAGAQGLLKQAPIKEYARLHPETVWTELNNNARQALQDGNPRTAYLLVADTGLTSGTEFSEAEFLAGWIALRFLKDPTAAVVHFEKLANGVSRPISVARAHYWLGRAYEQAGDPASAWQQYIVAAREPDTFYGQLALARIDPTPAIRFRDQPATNSPSPAAFENDDMVRAMRVLADLGAQDILRAFALHYEELHPDAGHAKLLGQTLLDMGFRAVSLRLAKAASYDNISLPVFAYPIIPVPDYRGPGDAPETALVLGIIRQETEFDVGSVSRAGARGIMQLMPASARQSAKQAGLPYRPNSLTTDPNYNMQLGMTEFSGYLRDWGNSPILSAAAYNAGATNAKKWIAAYGDPRSPAVDPIDWIEQIPFNETRNYVQRVIENMEVYRSRLAERDPPLRILADVYPLNSPATKVLSYKPPPPPPAAMAKPAGKPGDTASKSK